MPYLSLVKRRPLYIKTTIECDLDTLWEHTQDPVLHQQWDLRFTTIEYLSKANPNSSQEFLYETNILGIKINGTGESVATKTNSTGESTSVLKFASNSRISLIREGSGYWKYRPQQGGVQFITGYDYKTHWGSFGTLTDRLIFRPLMVWATAWSFDCLKNWIERGLHPKQALKAQWTVSLLHLALGMVWVYHGLVPKLLYPHAGELEMMQQVPFVRGYGEGVLTAVGWVEILFGLLCFFYYRKIIHVINIAAVTALFVGALMSKPAVFAEPFSPFSLTVTMIAISIVALQFYSDLPRASHCLTSPKE